MASEQSKETKLDPQFDRIQPIEGKNLKPFSGQVLSMVYAPHEGFQNYQVIRLTLEKDKVVKKEYVKNGTYYNSEEAIAWMTLINGYMLFEMTQNYPKNEQGENYRVA